MNQRHDLFLHEEIMLLALRGKQGTIEFGAWYQQAIGGAILAELLLAERIRLVDHKKKRLVEVAKAQPLGDPLIDECLRDIQRARKPAALGTWLGRFARKKDLKHRAALELCRRGILRRGEGRVLLIFSRRIYPEINPMPERALLARLEEAIFGDAPDVDPRTVVLVSLASRAGLLRAAFDKQRLRSRKARIDSIVEGEATGAAAAEAIRAMQAAMTVATSVPIIAST